MEFFDRHNEIKTLKNIYNRTKSVSQLIVITGRRRIGKTRLVIKALSDTPNFVYLFVAKKHEALLCQDFQSEIQRALDVPLLGTFTNFKDLFQWLLEFGRNKHITIVLDEFQNFYQINPAVFSDMQNLWDRYKHETKVNLIILGSVHSLMKKIFEELKEPLFGRADEKLIVSPFNVNDLKALFFSQCPECTNIDFLNFYSITGGVAKYVEIFVDRNSLNFDAMISEIFKENSLLLDEGKNLLIEEFGKHYTTYFSILNLIANSRTRRSEIESILGKQIGGYIDRLIKDYGILRVLRPIFSKIGFKSVHYTIDDNFLRFWFRFIYKNLSAIEAENYEYLKQIYKRDFKIFAGKILEKYFIEKLKLTGKFSTIGNYWEAGFKNEIDIVAVDNLNKYALIAEVKINKEKINLSKLKEKANNLIKKHLSSFDVEFKALSLEDM